MSVSLRILVVLGLSITMRFFGHIRGDCRKRYAHGAEVRLLKRTRHLSSLRVIDPARDWHTDRYD